MAKEGEEGKFWSMDAKALYAALGTSEKGLSAEEAAARIKQYGYNSVPDKDRREWLDILISQVRSPLLLILIFASMVSAYMGDVSDTIIIILVIAASVLLGFFQEYKSEKALSELKKYFVYHASPIRGGEKMQLDARELVPGDVVSVGLGDIVPADIRIMETKGIDMNEGILTGESREVRKSTAVPRSTSGPQDITNGLFMGTTVINGYALGVVIATGKQTFFGRTAALFSAKVPESDFQLEMRKFGNMLFRVIVVLTLFVFLSNFALGHGEGNPLADSALFALALAVGIAPEALPAVITIALSSGSLQLAKRKVIVKKLAAIEDLGNIDVLCTDKTGTLTEGDINAERFVDLEGRDSRDVFRHAFLCNAAVGSVKIRGNAIDVAIRKRGLLEKADVSGFTKVAEIPFDFQRRRMGQVVTDGKGALLLVKGAPESVLPICGKSGANAKKAALGYTANGYTTIAVAVKSVRVKKSYSVDDESGMELEGFILLSNPPKHSVRETLERLQKLNVRLKILTGDDPQVTRNVCSQLNFCSPEARLVLGRELEGMDEAARSEAVENCDVFARVTPGQKLLIVETLRKNGHVVGFLGDGINDASALRTADVGISVDTAADVAKGASHIILLKKSLNVVCDGIEGGRKVFGNITKYILNTMSANQGNMITVAITSLFLPFIPLLPSQILLNNMLSDLPMLSISSDNVDSVYTRKPQKWNLPFILRFMVFFGVISTIFDFVLVLILYFVLHVDVDTFRTAWFLESVLSEMIIVYSLRTQLPAIKSVPSKLLTVATVGAMIVSTAIIYIPLTASWFHFVPLGTGILLMIGGILLAYFAVTELGKALFFHWMEKKNHNGKNGNHARKMTPPALRAAEN